MSNQLQIHEMANWPNFRWDSALVEEPLAAVRHRQGRIIGRMESLGFDLRREAVLESLTEEIQKSSEIEGEMLDREQVRSSIARRLGMDIGALPTVDRNVEGIVEMMLDATRRYDAALSPERLFDWHASLFPTGRSGMRRIAVGGWRDDSRGPMQVVSGPIGHEKVHFVAPAASRLQREMLEFLDWFNAERMTDPVLKAGIAHLWFVTIHPFDDGNGRIARAIADMALARSEGTSQRFYSMSGQICKERRDYYRILEDSQKGTLDVTNWIEWFLGCLGRAFDGAETMLRSVLNKASFWDAHRGEPLNDRQRKLLNKMPDGFVGKLTTSKWAKIAKCSQDTAGRDIHDLVQRGILTKESAGGRSTNYTLALKSD